MNMKKQPGVCKDSALNLDSMKMEIIWGKLTTLAVLDNMKWADQ